MQEYKNRCGDVIPTSKKSVVRGRVGSFVLIEYEKKILLIWPEYSPDVLDLPGGGVDDGETLKEALIRETIEEAGLDISSVDLRSDYSHLSRFYAEDKDEYWDYMQHYFYIKAEEGWFFQGKKPSPESGIMEWINLNDISSYMINKAHIPAINDFISKRF